MPKVYISVKNQRSVIDRAHGRCEYSQSLADYATETLLSIILCHLVGVAQTNWIILR